ncbi:MAG: flagellar basal body-associated FliL family protein [Gammaproteobacteria bacterium]|nr:flagellar basal body-associated FliL family protein [Gammaproteobacteria bacterium]
MNKFILPGVFGLLAVIIAVLSTVLVMNSNSHDEKPVAAAAAKDAEATETEAGADGAAEGEEGEEGEDAAEGEEGEAKPVALIYEQVNPGFVVNILDGKKSRFMQVDVTVAASKQESLEAFKTHIPAIRNDLVILLGSQVIEVLRTTEGKEQLRKDVLATTQKVLTNITGEPQIEEVYITRLVIQ